MGMLDGKVAIVTGAGRGVGRGEAVALAAHGAKVVVDEGKITGVNPRNFRRSLFLTAWANDDGGRQHRLEQLFAGVVDLQRRKRNRTFQDIVAIDVVAVVRPADGAPPARTPIGRYQVKGGRFVWAQALPGRTP
jgi:hypothetical protein